MDTRERAVFSGVIEADTAVYTTLSIGDLE